MTRDEKNNTITELTKKLESNDIIYLADVSCMSVEESNSLRRQCYKNKISLQVVKNTLCKKAFAKVSNKDLSDFEDILVGNTSIMVAEIANAPAKLIKDFRKKKDRPILKGAYINASFYKGDDQLEALSVLKSKEEIIGDIILLLQSPIKNVLSSLNSSRSTISGILNSLDKRANQPKVKENEHKHPISVSEQKDTQVLKEKNLHNKLK